MKGDLHTHSTFSDGGIRIDRLPGIAAWAGMSHLAITDHDTFLSYDYALQHPQQDGVRLLPGMELSTWDTVRGQKVHLLCFYPDKTAELRSYFAEIGRRRTECQLRSVDTLVQRYPFLKKEEILAHAADSEVLFKAHIMRTFLEYGFTDRMYGELYHQLLGKGGPAYQPVVYPVPVREVLQMAHAARAVVIMAHPGLYGGLELAKELATEGVIDGVEVSHPGNSPAVQIELKNLAMQYQLIVTGGTDYHGMNEDHVCPVGSCYTASAQLERLLGLVEKRRGSGAFSSAGGL